MFPEKKAKFQNWRSSLKVHSNFVVEKVWNISEAFNSEQDQQPALKTNGTREE